MTPSQKRSLRVSWYGLSVPWPLYPDLNGQPYFLARNDEGRWFAEPGRSLAPKQQRQQQRQREVRR